jgi:hypothetical protein
MSSIQAATPFNVQSHTNRLEETSAHWERFLRLFNGAVRDRESKYILTQDQANLRVRGLVQRELEKQNKPFNAQQSTEELLNELIAECRERERQTAIEAVTSWKAPEEPRSRIRDLLETEMRQIKTKLLGFVNNPKATELDLSWTAVPGLPPGIFALPPFSTRLHSLKMSHIQTPPDAVLRSYKAARLHYPESIQELLENLALPKNLRMLDLSDNQTLYRLPSTLLQLEHLRNIDCSDTGLTQPPNLSGDCNFEWNPPALYERTDDLWERLLEPTGRWQKFAEYQLTAKEIANLTAVLRGGNGTAAQERLNIEKGPLNLARSAISTVEANFLQRIMEENPALLEWFNNIAMTIDRCRELYRGINDAAITYASAIVARCFRDCLETTYQNEAFMEKLKQRIMGKGAESFIDLMQAFLDVLEYRASFSENYEDKKREIDQQRLVLEELWLLAQDKADFLEVDAIDALLAFWAGLQEKVPLPLEFWKPSAEPHPFLKGGIVTEIDLLVAQMAIAYRIASTTHK